MIENKITELVEDTVSTLGYVPVTCRYYGGKKKKTLKVVIYVKGREVSTDDCVKVSQVLSRRLDVEDIIDVSYNLIVESPGVDHKLSTPKEFSIFSGKTIKVILNEPKKYELKDNVIIGELSGIDGETVFLKCNNERLKIALSDIAKANLFFDINKYL
jgi:ribosome maturation factor RimP